MVKELHRAGIEVILDVVYNHTAETDEQGPTLCFRGLENSFYYILNKDKATYANYTGAGNTLKANHSIVKRLILDSLRYGFPKCMSMAFVLILPPSSREASQVSRWQTLPSFGRSIPTLFGGHQVDCGSMG